MCGRFSQIHKIDVLKKRLSRLGEIILDLETNLDLLKKRFGIKDDTGDYPLHNIAKTDPAMVIYKAGGQLRGMFMEWGLIPQWWSPTKQYPRCSRPINAQQESLTSNGYFRDAFKSRRCLVPASGFFEFMETGAKPQPYWISSTTKEQMLLAGLWDTWTSPEEQVVHSFSIVTVGVKKETHPEFVKIHPKGRLAAILEDGGADRWLGENDMNRISTAISPFPDKSLLYQPAKPEVNNSKWKNSDFLSLAGSGAEKPLDLDAFSLPPAETTG